MKPIQFSAIKPGDIVRVRVYGGDVVERRVIRTQEFRREGQVVYITHPDEWAAANREHRDPTGIGFKLHDVVEHRTVSRSEQ